MNCQSDLPHTITMEGSPAESFVSAPGDNFTSLFGDMSTDSSTMNPSDMNMMTPGSSVCDDPSTPSHLSSIPEESKLQPPETEKKLPKKRKSWGQILPEPKTNLPPRKRAKTEDEKEQRRVERVIRNRRAAQTSRERKRKQVDGLEQRNKVLEAMVADLQQKHTNVMKKLAELGITVGPDCIPASIESITLAVDLSSVTDNSVESSAASPSNTNVTVAPASLSPPHYATNSQQNLDSAPTDSILSNSTQHGQQTEATALDMTQRPAVSVEKGVSGCRGITQKLCYLSDSQTGLDNGIDLPSIAESEKTINQGRFLASPPSSFIDDDDLIGDPTSHFFQSSVYSIGFNEILQEEPSFDTPDLVNLGAETVATFFDLEQLSDNLESQIS